MAQKKFDYKEEWVDWNKKRGLALMDISKEISISHFNALIGYLKTAINGAFFLNGTAAVAILYNIRQLPKEIHVSLCLCAIGAILAVICFGLAYISQYIYYKNDVKNNNLQVRYFFRVLIEVMKYDKSKERPPKVIKTIWGNIFIACVGLFWLGSIFSFSYAAYLAYPLIQSLSANQ